MPGGEGGGACRGSWGSGPGASPPSLSPHTLGYSWEGATENSSAQSQFYCKQQDRGCSGKLCVGVRKDGDRNQGALLPQHHTPGAAETSLHAPRKHKASAGRSPLPVLLPPGELAGSPLWGTGPAGLVGPGSADQAPGTLPLHTAPSSPLLTKRPSDP